MTFVKQAAGLAAAAVIAASSWVNTPTSFWLGQLFWSCSLWLSIFALISSAQQRLLDCLPTKPSPVFSGQPLERALRTMLKREKTGVPRMPDWKMIWVWQTPTMLMSFSWVTFLVGYGLYLLTPVLDGKPWTVQKISAVISISVGVVVVVNVFAIALLAGGVAGSDEVPKVSGNNSAGTGVHPSDDVEKGPDEQTEEVSKSATINKD